MARFEGTDNYVATQDLKMAVNAAITLERPLLIKGEPGTGKTVLAHEISKGLGAPRFKTAHALCGAQTVLRSPRNAGPQEKTEHVGIARLAETLTR